MSATPHVDVWHSVLSDRRQRDLPRLVAIHMHPRDVWALEREIHTTEHLRHTVRYEPLSHARLFDVTISVQNGVAEGWMVLETERPPSETAGTGLVMHQFRCLEHEDCRNTPELGLACWATQRHGTGEE